TQDEPVSSAHNKSPAARNLWMLHHNGAARRGQPETHRRRQCEGANSMLDKLSLLLKSKIALAAVGATLVAGGGASVAAAATGAQVPVVSQALHAATGTHDANDDKGQDAAGHDANDDKGRDGATGTPGADNDANDDKGQDASENEAQGTVSSVDASG